MNHHRRPDGPWLLLFVVAALAVLLASCPRHNPGPCQAATPSGCTICHEDVAVAFQGSKHRRKGIECTRCHGVSRAHIEDENNKVKPDRVFSRYEIDRWCDGCHFGSCKHAEVTTGRGRRTCADCHGAHRARIPTGNPRNLKSQ